MKLHFKPMPWLTVFSVLGLILLLKLGFWQKERLAWKLDVLARVEAAANAPAFTSLTEVVSALDAGDPVDFRRYAFETREGTDGGVYFVYDPSQGNISWRPYQPVLNAGLDVYVASAARLDDTAQKDVQPRTALRPNMASSGYVRLAPEPATGIGKLIQAKADPASNRWFTFNQDDLWADENTRMDIWLDEHKVEIDTDLPPLRPDIRNNHRDYMWTWFSFAGLLLIFYGLIHYRAGRLRFKDRAA